MPLNASQVLEKERDRNADTTNANLPRTSAGSVCTAVRTSPPPAGAANPTARWLFPWVVLEEEEEAFEC